MWKLLVKAELKLHETTQDLLGRRRGVDHFFPKAKSATSG
jgi:hypothetical protein